MHIYEDVLKLKKKKSRKNSNTKGPSSIHFSSVFLNVEEAG